MGTRARCIANVSIAVAVVGFTSARVVVRTLVGGERHNSGRARQRNRSTIAAVPAVAFNRCGRATSHFSWGRDRVRVSFMRPLRCRRGRAWVWSTMIHGASVALLSCVPYGAAADAAVKGGSAGVRGINLSVGHIRTRNTAWRTGRVRVEPVRASTDSAIVRCSGSAYFTGSDGCELVHVIAKGRNPSIHEITLCWCSTNLLVLVPGHRTASEFVR